MTIGIAAGVVGGYLLGSMLTERKLSSADEVLKRVKEKFRELGRIEGTWIVAERETFDNGVLVFDVYPGGITLVPDGEDEAVKYEFIADVKTGAILAVTTV